MKFGCPICNDVVEDKWINHAEDEGLIRCPDCKNVFFVSIRITRTEVIKFAKLMEEKLKANDHKSGWTYVSLLWLITKMGEEFGELSKLCLKPYLSDGQELGGDYHDAQLIEREAADVANIAMMIGSLIELARSVTEPRRSS